MKKILLFFAVVFLVASAGAQDLPTIPEPEFIGEAIIARPDVGDHRKLPKERASRRTAAGASVYLLGIGKATSKLTLPGKQSTLQVSDANKYLIIVRAESNNYDPVSIIQFIRLKQEGEDYNPRRTSELASASTLGAIETGNQVYVPFVATKYGESSYALTADLTPGEYGIIVNPGDSGNMIVATFGVFSQAKEDEAARIQQELEQKQAEKLAEKEARKNAKKAKRGQ